MAPRLMPKKLNEICIDSIVLCMNSIWLKEGTHMNKFLSNFPQSRTSGSSIALVMGPFESLNDETINLLIKRLYQNHELNRINLLFLLHNRLRRLDLSYIRKKKSTLINSSMATFIGNTCYNLIELSLLDNFDLSPSSFCTMIAKMKHLKKLHLSHAMLNSDVTTTIAKTCSKLEYLSLDNCKHIFDNCLENISNSLHRTLTHLSIDNVEIAQETIIKILLQCKNLKLFHTLELLNSIASLYKFSTESKAPNDEEITGLVQKISQMQMKKEDFGGTLNLETVHVDHIRLKSEHMESLSIICPLLKTININCMGEPKNLAYLCNFDHLTELLIANTGSLMSFKFDTFFLNVLKGPLGKNLRSLHLTYLVDVNLRSLAKHCQNLEKLNVEFISYYEPALDTSLSEADLNYDIITREIGIPKLKFLALSNLNNKYEHRHLNIGQFKKDLKLLISNCNIESLSLNGLTELEEEYFAELFTTPAPFNFKKSPKFEFIIDSIQSMEFFEIDNLPGGVFRQLLINENNSLKKLCLNNCKLISKKNYFDMVRLIKTKNLDCHINWV